MTSFFIFVEFFPVTKHWNYSGSESQEVAAARDDLSAVMGRVDRLLARRQVPDETEHGESQEQHGESIFNLIK